MPKFSLNRFFTPLFPYLILGIVIALLIGIGILLSYVLVWGVVIGAILWLITRIKAHFSPEENLPTQHTHKKGRTFEHHD